VPAVATNCGGVAQIITHELDGLLVPADSADDLALGMRQLMGNAGLRDRLGRNAIAISERYQLGAIIEKWNNLLATQCHPLSAIRSYS
jgi:GalNAc-alpha-(1->4)-GalNAc-alpha-(1->3)-diNAcBac-PP-undecaprenol alpha-1,4-N-acetyl-D-galactosaminyltransferase